MEKKKSYGHFIFLAIITLKMLTSYEVRAQQRTSVGVVVDMDDPVGEMAFNCINISLSDFYRGHQNHKTQIIVKGKNSKGTAIGAAAAAVDLLKNDEVQAIIGPLFSIEANFLIDIGDEVHVPIITFSASSPSLSSIRSPYFFRATVNDSYQVGAISALVKAFGWREVVPLYVDNDFGQAIVPYLNDALEDINARIPYRSVIPSQATDDQIEAELYKLMTMQTRVFVVHMLPSLGSRIFVKAKQIGMMSEDYAWIITDAIANVLDSLDPSVLDSMLGVIALRPFVPRTKELDDFTVRFKKRTNNNSSILNIFGLWAYDSATALAMAVEKSGTTNGKFKMGSNVSNNSIDFENLGVSISGPNLIQALSKIGFKGLAGNFQLANGQLQPPPYQILNLVGSSYRGIGYWTKENGIVKSLNSAELSSKTYSTSKNNLGGIIWPGDRSYPPPKGWVVPTNGKKLRIGVPVKDGFNEFVRVTWNSDNATNVEGYCRDVFDEVMATVPYGVPYEYIPFSNSDHKPAGTYNDLVDQVFFGKYDVVVGDVTIIANRSEYVDFTLPYTESGVSMVAPVKDGQRKNALVFLKPLTAELWLTTLLSFIFIGTLIWILEHRINKDFRGTPWHQVGIIFWFAFSTMVFAHKEKVVSNKSRLLLIIWFFLVLIITQSYTASLTTMLTVQQLQPTVTDVNMLIRDKENVGYQQGSFVFGMLKRLNFDESRLVAYDSPEELDELFSKGTKNGGIAAAFDEIPYIKLFLGKYCSKYTMVDPTYKTDGFGFVFPIGSPLVPDVSRAILNVTQGEKMVRIESKWFGDKTQCSDPSSALSSTRLGLESFWVLFLAVLVVGIVFFISYVVKFIQSNWDIIEENIKGNVGIWTTIYQLLERFDSRDPNARDFINNDNINAIEMVRHPQVENPPVNEAPAEVPEQLPAQHEIEEFQGRDQEIEATNRDQNIQA